MDTNLVKFIQNSDPAAGCCNYGDENSVCVITKIFRLEQQRNA